MLQFISKVFKSIYDWWNTPPKSTDYDEQHEHKWTRWDRRSSGSAFQQRECKICGIVVERYIQ